MPAPAPGLDEHLMALSWPAADYARRRADAKFAESLISLGTPMRMVKSPRQIPLATPPLARRPSLARHRVLSDNRRQRGSSTRAMSHDERGRPSRPMETPNSTS